MTDFADKKKWKGFGWNTISCDGHNISDVLIIS